MDRNESYDAVRRSRQIECSWFTGAHGAAFIALIPASHPLYAGLGRGAARGAVK
jgi:hypothetical protein